MKKYRLSLLATLFITTLVSSHAAIAAASSQPFTPAQTAAIEKIVKRTIIDHPEILVEAGKKLQAQQMKEMVDNAQKAAVKHARSLIHDSISPQLGNSAGKVTVIEFYDYQCSICHIQSPIMEKLVKNNPNVRFIFKQLPIFGPASQYAAQVTIIAAKQGKFQTFSQKLFDANLLEGKLKNTDVDRVAKSVDVKLPATDKNKTLERYFDDNMKLAHNLGFPGTPGIVIMPNRTRPDIHKVSVFLGYTKLDSLQDAIDKAQ